MTETAKKLDLKLTPCTGSSSLCGHGYDQATKTLGVQFKAGGPVYHFDGVPQDLYDEFTNSKSFGRFFQERIRGKFEHAKIDAAKTPEEVQ
mgnify:CR=1 FL=1